MAVLYHIIYNARSYTEITLMWQLDSRVRLGEFQS